MARRKHKPKNLSLAEVPQFSKEREVQCEKGYFWVEIENVSKTVQYRAIKNRVWV